LSDLELSQYLYDLPPELIAQNPESKRDESRMMVLRRKTRQATDKVFNEIVNLLDRGDLLVANDTRVIPARLLGEKEPGGAKVEVLLLRKIKDALWKAMVRPGRRLRAGAVINFEGGATGRIETSLDDGTRLISLSASPSLDTYLETHGITPLPPYIQRANHENEQFHRESYQTVFAMEPGSVAAPTAGLHFTPQILKALRAKGVSFATITLHVGPGTFRPVQVEDIIRHKMDEEFYTIRPKEAAAIQQARQEGRRVIAVGTTTTRTLEHVAMQNSGAVVPGSGSTKLFIYPGFKFQVIHGLLTNYHLPGSTLLMLVSAFAGRQWIMECYEHSVRQRYRFYSYGDCMLIL